MDRGDEPKIGNGFDHFHDDPAADPVISDGNHAAPDILRDNQGPEFAATPNDRITRADLPGGL